MYVLYSLPNTTAIRCGCVTACVTCFTPCDPHPTGMHFAHSLCSCLLRDVPNARTRTMYVHAQSDESMKILFRKISVTAVLLDEISYSVYRRWFLFTEYKGCRVLQQLANYNYELQPITNWHKMLIISESQYLALLKISSTSLLVLWRSDKQFQFSLSSASWSCARALLTA